MSSNMVDHVVAPLEYPIRLRTRLPATSVSGRATVTAPLVTFTTRMRNGDVEGLQFFSGNIASCIEVG